MLKHMQRKKRVSLPRMQSWFWRPTVRRCIVSSSNPPTSNRHLPLSFSRCLQRKNFSSGCHGLLFLKAKNEINSFEKLLSSGVRCWEKGARSGSTHPEVAPAPFVLFFCGTDLFSNWESSLSIHSRHRTQQFLVWVLLYVQESSRNTENHTRQQVLKLCRTESRSVCLLSCSKDQNFSVLKAKSVKIWPVASNKKCSGVEFLLKAQHINVSFVFSSALWRNRLRQLKKEANILFPQWCVIWLQKGQLNLLQEEAAFWFLKKKVHAFGVFLTRCHWTVRFLIMAEILLNSHLRLHLLKSKWPLTFIVSLSEKDVVVIQKQLLQTRFLTNTQVLVSNNSCSPIWELAFVSCSG